MVHLDRGEPQPLDAWNRAGLADEPRERIAGLAVAEAAEIHPGEHDLAMALRNTPANLAEHRARTPAPGSAADERDHAEGAGKGAAVLDLDERTCSLDARVAADATDRADVSRNCVGCLAPDAREDRHVFRQSFERTLEPGPATHDEDTPVRSRAARDHLARLRHGFVRDAARIDDGDVGRTLALGVPVGEQPLANTLGIGERDLAAEKTGREGRHRGTWEIRRSDATLGGPAQVSPAPYETTLR